MDQQCPYQFMLNNSIIDRRYTVKIGTHCSYTNKTGAFFAMHYTIIFCESLKFSNNNGMAMYLTSNVMKITPNTSVTFLVLMVEELHSQCFSNCTGK